MVTAQRKTLAEKEQLIMELKYSLESKYITLGFYNKHVYYYDYYNHDVSLLFSITMDKEHPHDQSSTNTLSGMYNEVYNYVPNVIEKLKLLDRMNKAKTLEIDKLTRYKEGEL